MHTDIYALNGLMAPALGYVPKITLINLTRFFLQSDLFFPGCSMPSVSHMVVHRLVCLLRDLMQSLYCMCLQLQIPRLGSKILFSISGMISLSICFPLCSSQADFVMSPTFDQSLYDPGSSFMATKGVMCRSPGSLDGRTS